MPYFAGSSYVFTIQPAQYHISIQYVKINKTYYIYIYIFIKKKSNRLGVTGNHWNVLTDCADDLHAAKQIASLNNKRNY